MPQSFVIDQAATFAAVAFLSAEPKMVFGEQGRQDTGRDGVPRWTVEVVAAFRQFDKITNEVLKVNLASHKNPAEGLDMYTPIQMIGFVVGVTPPEERTDKDGRKKVVGGTAWYRAERIFALNSVPTPTSRKAE
jgi:hypothetical protein